MKFLKNAIEGLYLAFNDTKKSQKEVLGNVKFFFPLPMFFFFSGIGAHLLLDFQWMVDNVIPSQFYTLVFGFSFALLAYPISYKYIFPQLQPDQIDLSQKKKLIWIFIIYFVGCFAGWIFLGWLTNLTSLLPRIQ